MLTAWFYVVWLGLRGAHDVRPSALSRFYALLWTYIGLLALLVLITVAENQYDISGGYFIIIYIMAVFVALWLGYFELLGLPRRSAFVEDLLAHQNGHGSASLTSSRPLTANTNDAVAEGGDHSVNGDDDPTESTSLLRGDARRTTFASGYGTRRHSVDESSEDIYTTAAGYTSYENEQLWSASLPSWLWIFQFLVVAPIVLILVGQIALLLTDGLKQTPADGNSVLVVYLFIAVLTILILAPVAPFIHRFTYHVPTFLLLVLIGTLIYNLIAFPFSSQSRLKVYFEQRIDLDNKTNTVQLTGVIPYVQQVAESLPSAHGQKIDCSTPLAVNRKELRQCRWQWSTLDDGNSTFSQWSLGRLPTLDISTIVAGRSHIRLDKASKAPFKTNITHPANTTRASFHISASNTKSCRLFFDTPVTDLIVGGANQAPSKKRVGPNGCRELRLWHREWEQDWDVDVEWESGLGAQAGGQSASASMLTGRVACIWADANDGAVPAFAEANRFAPAWATVSKGSDALIEVSRRFEV